MSKGDADAKSASSPGSRSATPLQVMLKVRICRNQPHRCSRRSAINLLNQRIRPAASSVRNRTGQSGNDQLVAGGPANPFTRHRPARPCSRRGLQQCRWWHDARPASAKIFQTRPARVRSTLMRTGRVLVSTLAGAELDSAFRRNRKLPRRRRIPDPCISQGKNRQRGHDHRIQAVRCRLGLHPDRSQRWPDLDARSPRGERAERPSGSVTLKVGTVQRSGSDHTARGNDGRARLGPVVHDCRPAAEHRSEQQCQSARRRSLATCRSSAPCSARLNYPSRDETGAGHNRHAVSGAAGVGSACNCRSTAIGSPTDGQRR